LYVWVALALFVFMSAAMGSVLRLTVGGASEAFASRYVVYIALFYVALSVCSNMAWPFLSKTIQCAYVLVADLYVVDLR
jgi:hypothetical protein